jgi:hypothetical protein
MPVPRATRGPLMHLHDALRLWRTEIVSTSTEVGLADSDVRGVPDSLLSGLSRETLPGGLRRDDRTGVQAVLAPAEHHPARPATGAALDALETRLGFELPRPIELLLSLHDGGTFFAPTLAGLSDDLSSALQIFSCAEIGEAYGTMVTRLAATLIERDPDDNDFFRFARRFGASTENADALAGQLAGIRNGSDRGLEIVPIARVPGSEDLITFVGSAGKSGRVGHAYTVSGYLPEHSDEFPFHGLEGWLEALVRGKGCRRIAT